MNDFAERLSKTEIIRKIMDAGFNPTQIELNNNKQAQLVDGKVQFDKKPSGLTIHTTNTIENGDGKATSEVSERINILVLIEGDIKFAFNQNQYQITAAQQPVLLMSVINGTEVFTRYFQQNCRVKKVTISVDKDWLFSRCKSINDLKIMERLFSSSSQVHHWPCDTLTLSLANELLNVNQSEDICQQLKAEQIGFQLFNLSYSKIARELGQQSERALSASMLPVTDTIKIHSATNTINYEAQVARFIKQSLTLAEIADKLGASISTLQRYFKTKHQMTLKEYIRVQKLEQARRSLLFEQQTIGEASYFAGYNHVSNFVTAFKKHFDITPAELQKQTLNIGY